MPPTDAAEADTELAALLREYQHELRRRILHYHHEATFHGREDGSHDD